MLKRPIKFIPYYKSVVWGGDVIATYKGENIPGNDVGESWEISAVPGYESVVTDDPELEGLTLTQLVQRYPSELLGEGADPTRPFPLLIKIIDAHADLSVQVHPDDDLAKNRNGGQGKTEMWYIVSARPGAKIFCGLSAPLSPEEYDKRVLSGDILDVIGKHESKPGQFYFVPAGTLHAIGAGNLLIEVQQTSDITYRVFDYNRLDSNGNARELHTAEAREAIDYTFPNDIEPMAKIYPGTALNVVDCEYFCTSLLEMRYDDVYTIDNEGRSFAIVIVVDGSFKITDIDGNATYCMRGHTILLPASMDAATLSGSGKALIITR